MKNSLVAKITIAGALVTGGAAFAANATANNSFDPLVSADTAVTPFAIVDEFNLGESNVEEIESFAIDLDDYEIDDIEAEDADDDADEVDDGDANEIDDDDSDDDSDDDDNDDEDDDDGDEDED